MNPARASSTATPPAIARLRRIVDAVLPWAAGGFYVLVALEELDAGGPPLLAAIVLAAAQGTTLRWRREHPQMVAAVVLVLSFAYLLLVPELVVPFTGMIATFSLAALRPPRISLVGLVGLLVVCAINFFTTTFGDAWFTMVVAVAVWALGEAARNRRAAIQEAASRAVRDEQSRIARELHDVIAHSVSVIVVQASAANDVYDARPEQARAALTSIEAAGRDALRELRVLLGAVRSNGEDGPQPPQPGLAQLAELIAPLEAAGLRVTIDHEGLPSTLPMGVDVSSYRIVQEALTNTLRHAQATSATVTFHHLPDAIEIDVVDDGQGRGGHSAGGAGLGLIGMRERAAVLGGTLEAGPTAHGGFRVRARLPVEPACTRGAADATTSGCSPPSVVTARPGSMTCSTASGSPAPPTGASRATRWACASGWRSPRRCSATRRC